MKQGQVNSGQPNIPGKLIRNIYGADLGMPIKKDKLFFFGNWEAYRRRESSSEIRTAPTASLSERADCLPGHPDHDKNPVHERHYGA